MLHKIAPQLSPQGLVGQAKTFYSIKLLQNAIRKSSPAKSELVY